MKTFFSRGILMFVLGRLRRNQYTAFVTVSQKNPFEIALNRAPHGGVRHHHRMEENEEASRPLRQLAKKKRGRATKPFRGFATLKRRLLTYLAFAMNGSNTRLVLSTK